ncbi:MAG: hypothetical protein R3C05_20455 [Pirellulaceae bacterium]
MDEATKPEAAEQRSIRPACAFMTMVASDLLKNLDEQMMNPIAILNIGKPCHASFPDSQRNRYSGIATEFGIAPACYTSRGRK